MFGVDSDDVKALTDTIENCAALVEAAFNALPERLAVQTRHESHVAVAVEARLIGACVVVAGAVIAGAVAIAANDLSQKLEYLDDTLERVNMREPG